MGYIFSILYDEREEKRRGKNEKKGKEGEKGEIERKKRRIIKEGEGKGIFSPIQ